MASPEKNRSSTPRVSSEPRREPVVEAKLPRATIENSLLLKLLHDCPLEIHLAVHRVANRCSLAGATNLYHQERGEQLRRRDLADPESDEYGAIQRRIDKHAARGVDWQADRTPMRLLERLAKERLGGPFDEQTAKVSDLWDVVATHVVVEQRDLTVYGIPEFMLLTVEADAEGRSRRVVADLLKAQLGKGMYERVSASTKRLAGRSATQRVRDELAALDVLPRVYRGLDILVGSREADEPEIRRLLLSETVPLVREMNLHWPSGLMTSGAEQARDANVEQLLIALGDCDAEVPTEAIAAIRRAQSMLRAVTVGVVNLPVGVPVREAKQSSGQLKRETNDRPHEWRSSLWIVAAVNRDGRKAPAALAASLRAYARQRPRPSCVRRAPKGGVYSFDVSALIETPQFAYLRAELEDALASGFIPSRLRSPKRSGKAKSRRDKIRNKA